MVILPLEKSSPKLLVAVSLGNEKNMLFIFKNGLLVQQILICYKDILVYYT